MLDAIGFGDEAVCVGGWKKEMEWCDNIVRRHDAVDEGDDTSTCSSVCHSGGVRRTYHTQGVIDDGPLTCDFIVRAVKATTVTVRPKRP